MNCAYCEECDLVGNLEFSQEGASETNQSVFEISKNTVICRSSVCHNIHYLSRATDPVEKNMPIWLVMYYWVV